jgi:hypothetical protein
VTQYKQGHIITNIYPAILTSVSGLDQIHCALCSVPPGVKTRSVTIATKLLRKPSLQGVSDDGMLRKHYYYFGHFTSF